MREMYLVSVWLHIVAAMTWVGGMVLFVVAVMPYFLGRTDAEKAAFMEWFGPRFRTTAWVCFAVLAITGTFNLWARGVRLDTVLQREWWITGFGHVLAIKLVLVVIAVVLTVSHERVSPPRARLMGRALLFVGLAIVAAAVSLVR